VCLLARVAEENGIPTVVLSTTRDILARAKAPRGVFGNFPTDHPLGRPLDVEFQMNVLKSTLNAFTEVTEPGKVIDLPFRWSDDFSWQDWLDAMICYLDKRNSRLKQHKIWYDEEGKAHRTNEFSLPVPGWDSDWEGK
jgi:hypothetical protein